MISFSLRSALFRSSHSRELVEILVRQCVRASCNLTSLRMRFSITRAAYMCVYACMCVVLCLCVCARARVCGHLIVKVRHLNTGMACVGQVPKWQEIRRPGT